MPTHFKGPLTGSYAAGGGLYKDLPFAYIDRGRSNYTVWYEDFTDQMADGDLATRGCTVTDRNTATAPTETVTFASLEGNCLIINPGSKADSGTEVQCNVVPAYVEATSTNYVPPLQTPQGVVSTATLMDGRELRWGCRFGLRSNSATVWDGKVMVGWVTDDNTMLINTDGLPGLPTGGGIGFHVGENGVISYFGQQGALTTAPTTTIKTHVPTAANVTTWYECGFKWKSLDASAGTGVAEFYFNGIKVGTIQSGLPMASTQTYSVSWAVQNGPAQQSDLLIDYNFVTLTGPGRTT
jgi:hypothetical protein